MHWHILYDTKLVTTPAIAYLLLPAFTFLEISAAHLRKGRYRHLISCMGNFASLTVGEDSS